METTNLLYFTLPHSSLWDPNFPKTAWKHHSHAPARGTGKCRAPTISGQSIWGILKEFPAITNELERLNCLNMLHYSVYTNIALLTTTFGAAYIITVVNHTLDREGRKHK